MGCGGKDSAKPADAPTQPPIDASADASMDSAVQARSDGGNEATQPPIDASVDVSMDSAMQARSDGGNEATQPPVDASVDVSTDGSMGTGDEATANDGRRDTGDPPDATIDASPDTGEGSVAATGFNFDRDLEGWGVTYTSAQQGSAIIAPGAIALSLNTIDGRPNPGSLQADIPYSMPGQYIGLGITMPVPVNLLGKLLTAQVKIVSGLESAQDLMTSPAGATLYVKSGPSYVYASGGFANLTAVGSWVSIAFDLEHPVYIDMTNPGAGPFDPSDIREFGVQFDTSGATTTAQPAVVLVDTVSY